VKFTKFKIFVFILFFLLFNFTYARGKVKKPEITDVLITHSEDNLVVNLKLKGGFNKKLVDAILSGIPVSFNFRIKLIRKKRFWFDSVISSFSLVHLIKKDQLKEEYYIYLDEKESNPVTTSDFEKAKNILCSIEDVHVIPLVLLKLGEILTIKIKASAECKKPPFLIHYIPFFSSWKNFETNWYTETFQFKSKL